ncbi:GroES-like protein [Stereum hirsutum FP-91666 SS1]|uniref:GroES-like protein n=1 Tax=Stereum hirsutum (strain FP-91666) TaxID=721885 RepID=UPI0004449320|nr:GroES-like protein [Stereum hirsutum FP-91666 SS1]EIM83601.1 GroES-like protein [Stereum hirsutum FP-91666 SS1]
MPYPETQNALVCAAIGEPFEIKERPVPKPGPGQVLVKIVSAALNPVDELIRVKGIHVKGALMSTYPTICGSDAAGTVAALGEGVDNLKIGDRVVFQNWFVPDRGTFQQYALSDAGTTAKIPENLSFDEAATVPIGLATAVMGFYGGKASEERGGAGLPVPWEESGRDRFRDEPIFITGGASSVGQFVIQMAKLSGFGPIITTASAQHTEYCKFAGATHIIDYHTTPYSSIPSAVASILSPSPTASNPLKFTWDCIGNEETNALCWTMLAPSGTMIVARCAPVYWPNVVLPAQATGDGRKEGKKAYFSAGNVNLPINKVLGENLYANLEQMLRDGRVKPNHLEVLPGGLVAIADGLTRIVSGKAAGVKLIVHPQETA